MNYLLDYYNEIQKGNIVVGKELFTVIESLIDDMDNPRYIFDENQVTLELSLLKHFVNILKVLLMDNLSY